MSGKLLQVDGLGARYGRAEALRDMAFDVAPGEAIALLGRNGAGKSTTLKAIMGLLRPRAGRVVLDSHDLAGAPPFRIARAGIGYVPEDRRIFAELTVRENLAVGRRKPRPGLAPWDEARLFALFPNLEALRDRPSGRMSGGEQQMLTIARTLMGNPRVLLLDEPSEGIAPIIVAQMADAIRACLDEGLAVVLAEQSLGFAGRVASLACVIETGRPVWTGRLNALMEDAALRSRYLAV